MSETNSRGNKIIRGFICDGDRYAFDAQCTAEDGWVTYDSDSDAWYHGVWINQAQRAVLTYVEGDIIRVEAPDHDSFMAEVDSLVEFYGAPAPELI